MPLTPKMFDVSECWHCLSCAMEYRFNDEKGGTVFNFYCIHPNLRKGPELGFDDTIRKKK